MMRGNWIGRAFMSDHIRRSLTAMKRKGGERTYAKMAGRLVYIYSGEHHAWWRVDGIGYTDDQSQAGIWEFEDAYRTTEHCGPEKRILFVGVY